MNMTRYLILALALLLGGQCMQARRAVLMAHYGSSDDATRAATIDLITADVKAALPGIEVRQALISPVVRRNLAARGLHADSPDMALLRLATEGYDTVYIQPSTILDGEETAEVRRAADRTRPFFSCLEVGKPLCFSPDDCLRLVDLLLREPKAADEAVIFVGHGNNLPSTATYCQLDYMMASSGKPGYQVSTIEGYPTAHTTLARLATDKKVRRVRLVPLLLVCGNHTRHDIAGDFADVIRAAGLDVRVQMRGLAELPAIRALYVDRVLRLTATPQATRTDAK